MKKKLSDAQKELIDNWGKVAAQVLFNHTYTVEQRQEVLLEGTKNLIIGIGNVNYIQGYNDGVEANLDGEI